ncbi:DDB1- and CUL4-associated factor homolog 1 [Trichonephila clavipes]|nr:DDB1- and CUL4-associated factor homolog 1 [Trichonephila clavipes]
MVSPVKANILSDGSNSSWVELEHYVIGSFQVYPLNIAVEQRFILEYLTPMGEYQDLLGHIVEEKALPLIMKYIDLNQNSDVRLAFEALKRDNQMYTSHVMQNYIFHIEMWCFVALSATNLFALLYDCKINATMS